jgi:hypothetical protein
MIKAVKSTIKIGEEGSDIVPPRKKVLSYLKRYLKDAYEFVDVMDDNEVYSGYGNTEDTVCVRINPEDLGISRDEFLYGVLIEISPPGFVEKGNLTIEPYEIVKIRWDLKEAKQFGYDEDPLAEE